MTINCIEILKEKYKDKISEEDLKNIDSKLQNARAISGNDIEYNTRANEIYTNYVRENVRAVQAKISNSRAASLQSEFVVRPEVKNDPKLAWKAYTFGDSAGVIEGGNAGVRATAAANSAALVAGPFKKISDLGIGEVLLNGGMHREIFEAMFEFREKGNQQIIDNIKSKHPVAYKAALAFKEFNQSLSGFMKSSGVVVGQIENYITQRMWSPEKIRQIPKEQWVSDVFNASDMDAAVRAGFKDANEFVKHIEDSYDHIINGNTGFYEADVPNDKFISKRDGKNINVQSNKKRSFHFKDGKAEFDMWQKYGSGNLLTNMIEAAQKGALNAEGVKRFGVDVRQGVKDFADKINVANGGKFISEREAIDRYEAMFGFSKEPGSNIVQQATGWIKVHEIVSKLGGAVKNSFSDIGFGGSALGNVRAERSPVSNMIGIVANMAKQIDPAFRKEVLSKFQLFTQDMMKHMMSGEMDGMSRAGLQTKLLNNYFKLNLLDQWSRSGKSAVAVMYSNILHNFKDASFKDIDPFLRDHFVRNNINEKNWNIIRQGVDVLSDGRNVITPEALDRLDINTQEKLQAKSALIRAYNDLGNISFITSNESSRNLLRFGTSPNSAAGSLLSLVTMFKSFVFTTHDIIHRTALTDPTHRYQSLPQAFKGEGAKFLVSRGAANVASLVAMTTAMGAISEATGDILSGKTPRTPDNQEFWERALARSGSLGLAGDFLLGEQSRTGSRGWLAQATGPIGGDIQTLGEIYGKLRSDKNNSKSIEKQVYQLMKSNIPYGNLFYVKGALDYGIHYRIMEMRNPGALRRLQKNVEKGGQQFFIPPAEVIE